MHVDGFRFDLAAALARELHDVDQLCAFFDIIHQDPVLSQVKLIAEPWDVGRGRLPGGQFPRAVDGVERPLPRHRARLLERRRGARRRPRAPAHRLRAISTSATAASPCASINFVTAHDGFTLRDLVTYNDKHNEANGEDNRDGSDDNRSWNCGAEGADRRPGRSSRCATRQQRNFLATLLLSQGVPMLLGGDEIGRTQQGNNNAYCQDNELSWFDWGHDDQSLLEYVRQLIRLRQTEPVFRRRDFLAGADANGTGLPDVLWLRPDGREVGAEDWGHRDAHALAVFFNGEEIPSHDRDGDPVTGASFLLLFNASHETVTFAIPMRLGRRWALELSTDPTAEQRLRRRRANLPLSPRSVVVLRQR